MTLGRTMRVVVVAVFVAYVARGQDATGSCCVSGVTPHCRNGITQTQCDALSGTFEVSTACAMRAQTCNNTVSSDGCCTLFNGVSCSGSLSGPDCSLLSGTFTVNATCLMDGACVVLAPCNVTSDCPSPADDDRFCEVRECWDGACMNVSTGELVCDTLNPCTHATPFSNVTSQQCECANETHIANCCQQAVTDCAPDVWQPVGACERAECVNYTNVTGTGVCAAVPENVERCCDPNEPDANVTCTTLFANNCTTSTCEPFVDAQTNKTTGVCSDPVVVDCSVFDVPTNSCVVGRCGASTGQCSQVTLGADECPGACCLGTECVDQTIGDAGMDRAWCFEEGGRAFYAGELCTPDRCATAEPSPEPTREPTLEPSVAPTPEPTVECVIDADCPSNPATKCLAAHCDTATCTIDVVVDCEAERIERGLSECYVGECVDDIGLCQFKRNSSLCCTPDDADHCPHAGGVCTEVLCIVVDNATTGTCETLTNETHDGCCESDTVCRDSLDDLCSLVFCNHVTNRCDGFDRRIVCPDTFDLCTDPVCDASDGECKAVRVAHQPKCPGACCVDANQTCRDDLDHFECIAEGGAFVDSNVSCSSNDNGSATCGFTLEPTPSPAPASSQCCCTDCSMNVSCFVTLPSLCSDICEAQGCGVAIFHPDATCETGPTCPLSVPTSEPTSAPTSEPSPTPTPEPSPAAARGSCCCTKCVEFTICTNDVASAVDCTLMCSLAGCIDMVFTEGGTCETPCVDLISTQLDASVLTYAETLCRDIYACGDADEPLCMSGGMDATLLAECERLNCCDVIGVPGDNSLA